MTFFLKCTGNANKRGWGESGKNGADCTFTADEQEMSGCDPLGQHQQSEAEPHERNDPDRLDSSGRDKMPATAETGPVT